MRILILVMCLLVSGGLFANERMDKIEALMRAQGLIEIWQQQLDMGKVESRKQARSMIDQLLGQLNPNDEFRTKFEKVYFNFMEKLEDRWSAEQIVKIWAEIYGPNFSDDELDALIAFYESELGQKEVRVTRSSMVEFYAYFQKKNQPILEKATQEFIDELQLLARQCNCSLKPEKNTAPN